MSHSSSAPLICKQEPHCYPSRRQLQHQLQLSFFFTSSRCFLSSCPQPFYFLYFNMFVRRKHASSFSSSFISISCSSSLLLLVFLPCTRVQSTPAHLEVWLATFGVRYSLMCLSSAFTSTAYTHGAPGHITGMLVGLVPHFLFCLFMCCLVYLHIVIDFFPPSHLTASSFLWASHAHFF